MQSHSRSGWGVAVLSFLALLTLSILAFIVSHSWASLSGPAWPVAFDEDVWGVSQPEQAWFQEWRPPTVRQRMLPDLIARHLRIGMSRGDVSAVLGDSLTTWRVDARQELYPVGFAAENAWQFLVLDYCPSGSGELVLCGIGLESL